MTQLYPKITVNQVFLTEREKNLLLNLSLQPVSKKKLRAVEHFKCKSTPKFACRECRRKTRTIKVPQTPREKFLANPVRYVKRMGAMKRQILNAIIYWCKAFQVAYPSHEMIAAYVGCSPSHVKQSINEFLEVGLIGQRYIGKKGKANEYEISPAFAWGWLKKQIGSFFTNLTSFFLEQLMSINKGEKKECIPYISILNTSPNFSPSPQPDLKKSSHQTAGNSNAAGQEKYMSHVPAHIEAIKSLRLASSGQVKLAKYSQTAIEFADSQIQRRSNISKPFSYFEKLAKDQQNLEGQPLDYRLFNELVAVYGQPIDGKELLEPGIIKWDVDVAKRSLGTKDQTATKRSQQRDESAAHYTSGSNAQADWWKETFALRDIDHDEYLRRIKTKQKPFNKKGLDEKDTVSSSTPTELDLLWGAWQQDSANAVYLETEAAYPDTHAGYAYKMFLAGRHGQYFLERQSPVVRKILMPLLSRRYPAESEGANTPEPSGTVSAADAASMPEIYHTTMRTENTVQTQAIALRSPEGDREDLNESIWEEIYE